MSVVIPVHNPDGSLQRLVEGIDAQARAQECIVALVVSDDGSPMSAVQSCLAILDTGAVDLQVVRSNTNRGPGAARNLGLAEVRTPWVVFMDADMVPGPGWLGRLLELAADPDAPDGVEGRVEVPLADRATPFTHATDLSGPGGAGNVAYRTEVLRAQGGFDERYFDARRGLHFREDTALHFAMVAAGRRVEWRSDIVAIHPPLPASYIGPVRLARRYYFDPLLSREHGQAFSAMTRARSFGGISLRRARHDFAVLEATGLILSVGGVLLGRRRVRHLGLAAVVVAWPANAAALAWKRQVRPRDAPALAAIALVAPMVYLWHHTRGVIAFRHRPHY